MNLYKNNIQFRTLLNATALEVIGSGVFNLAFIVYAATMPNPKLAITAVTLINAIPMLLQVVTGYYADQTINRYRHIMWVRTGQVLAYLLLSFLIGFQTSWLIFGALLAINFFSDLFGSYSDYLVLPIQQKVIDESDYLTAQSLQTAVRTTINLVAQLSGASLLALLHNNFVLFGLFNALIFALSLLNLFLNRHYFTDTNRQIRTVNEPKQSFIAGNKANFKLLQQIPGLLQLVTTFTAGNFIMASFSGLLQISILEFPQLQIGTYGFSIAFWETTFAVGAIAGSIFSNDFFKNMSLKHLMLISDTLTLLIAFILAIHPSIWLGVPLTFGIGYILGKLNPKAGAYFMKIIPENNLSAISSIMATISTLAYPVGQSLFLGIATATHTTTAWWTIVIVSVPILIYTQFAVSNEV